MNLSLSLSLSGCSRNRQTRRRDEDAARDAHTREARSRLARPARRDLRPLRQRHLLHTDAAPAAARAKITLISRTDLPAKRADLTGSGLFFLILF